MNKIKFYKNIVRSYVDLPSHISLVIHNISCGCNLKCYGCFNYKDLISCPPNEYYYEQDITDIIKKQGYIVDALIFSGGEFLLEDIKNIKNFLIEIRKIFKGKIIIYTNGTSFDKVKFLLENKLVDGFHVDMKLPYHLMDIEKDRDIFKDILGIYPTEDMINNILLTIDFIIQDGSKYHQIRTVEYPILTNDYFDEIKTYLEDLEKKYNTKIDYKLNKYIDTEE